MKFLQSCCWCDLADSFISNRYNAKASTLLETINYNVTPLLSNELRYRATIVQSITRILDLLTFRSRASYTYVYQNIWKKNSLTTDSPFSISRQRATGTVESKKQTKRGRLSIMQLYVVVSLFVNLSFPCSLPLSFSFYFLPLLAF